MRAIRNLRTQRRWRLGTLAALAALIGSYWVVNRQAMTWVLGWTAAALLVFLSAISARKRLAFQGPGKMSAWLNAHIYVGCITIAAVLLHAGFRLGGWLSGSLLGVFLVAAGSGLFGLVLSRTLPPLLTSLEESPAIVDQLISIRDENYRGLLELTRSGSPEFRAAVEGRLLPETSSWRRMTRFYRSRSTVAEELPGFQSDQQPVLAGLDSGEHRAFHRAAEYALRVNKMNAELFLQRTMRGWLTLHIAATVSTLVLAAMHVFAELYY